MNKIPEILEKNPEIGRHDILDFGEISKKLDTLLQADDISLDVLFSLKKDLEKVSELTLGANKLGKLMAETIEHLHAQFQQKLEESLAMVRTLSGELGGQFDISKEALTKSSKTSFVILMILIEIEKLLATLEPKLEKTKEKKKVKKQKFSQLQAMIREAVKAQTQTQGFAQRVNKIILGKEIQYS